MSNTVYKKAAEGLITAKFDLSADDIKVAMIDLGAYTPNFNTDRYLSDVPGAAIIATSGNLSGKTVTDGVFDASDIVFTTPGPAGTTVEALLIYKDTGSSATSPLLELLDTGLGLPITLNGANVTIVWDNTDRIFKVTT